jgi:hypothetical protein
VSPNATFLYASLLGSRGTVRSQSVFFVEYEQHQEGKLIARCDEIKLAAFPLPNGAKYWLPTHGVYRSYLGQPGADKKPVVSDQASFEETCNIFDGTVKFNQGLSDKPFTTESLGTDGPDKLRAARSEFEKLKRQSRTPAAQEQQIQTTITEAEQQRHYLEAFAPSGALTSSTALGSGLLVAFGVGAIGAAWFLRRRNQ